MSTDHAGTDSSAAFGGIAGHAAPCAPTCRQEAASVPAAGIAPGAGIVLGAGIAPGAGTGLG
ncbi:hypothetical protein DDE19_30460, partial [Micromonospora ureilytica]